MTKECRGEAVARLHVTETDEWPEIRVEVLNGEGLQPGMSPIEVYLAAPQASEALSAEQEPVDIVSFCELIDDYQIATLNREEDEAGNARVSLMEAYRAALNTPANAENRREQDGKRFRWLTEDHADAEVRSQCRSIIESMGVRSYSATCRDIDLAMGESDTPSAENRGEQAECAPRDWLFRSRTADLLHLLSFASIDTSSAGDAEQAQKAITDLRALLEAEAAPRTDVEKDAGLTEIAKQLWSTSTFYLTFDEYKEKVRAILAATSQ